MKTDNRRICIHHVGGRAGTRAFPILPAFEKDIVNVLYDVDADCISQIQEMNQGLKSELHVLPYCLGDACKTTHININYDPYTSSLYDIDPKYAGYYCFNCDHDYLLSEAGRTMEKRQVEMVTLDYVFQKKDMPVPMPDFISIDTEGSEYEILLGARETLKSNVVAIVLEAGFFPLRKGQKLFGDLVKLLSDQGFDFVRFLGIHEFSRSMAPVGLRGEGRHTFCDALFFRQMDNIDMNGDEIKYSLMLQKLSFIAIMFNQFEYGVQCLRQSKTLVNRPLGASEEEHFYQRFLKELDVQIGKAPIVYPPAFVSKYPSFTESKSRFKSSIVDKTDIMSKGNMVDEIKKLLKRIPVLYLFLKWIKDVLSKVFPKIVISIRQVFMGHTNVERVLIKYGLKSQANVLKKNRLIQMRFLKKVIKAGR